jgi:hypothetical protein
MRILRALLAAVLGALALVVLTASPSYACSCAAADTRQHVERADVVVTGTVRGTAQSEQTAAYLLDVDRVYRGSSGPVLEVMSPVNGASCGLEGLVEDGRYVVFAAAETVAGEPSDVLWANLCGGTAPASAQYVDALEAVTGPGSPPAADDHGGVATDELAYTSTLDLRLDGPERAVAGGGLFAVAVAATGGLLLSALVGGSWLRWRRMP